MFEFWWSVTYLLLHISPEVLSYFFDSLGTFWQIPVHHFRMQFIILGYRLIILGYRLIVLGYRFITFGCQLLILGYRFITLGYRFHHFSEIRNFRTEKFRKTTVDKKVSDAFSGILKSIFYEQMWYQNTKYTHETNLSNKQ